MILSIAIVLKPYRIFLSPPHISGNEISEIQEVIASGYVAPSGPKLIQFEEALTAICAASNKKMYCVALNSGTAAIHLALLLLQVQPGDEIISASMTFVGAVNPIVQAGAHPVFVDSENETWNMDPHWLRVCIRDRISKGKKIGAVIVTYLYGRVARMNEILNICAEENIPVIEDAAEALGASYNQKMAGTLGAIGVYSFNGNKVVTTGGGRCIDNP